jgi:hypothetical protein
LEGASEASVANLTSEGTLTFGTVDILLDLAANKKRPASKPNGPKFEKRGMCLLSCTSLGAGDVALWDVDFVWVLTCPADAPVLSAGYGLGPARVGWVLRTRVRSRGREGRQSATACVQGHCCWRAAKKSGTPNHKSSGSVGGGNNNSKSQSNNRGGASIAELVTLAAGDSNDQLTAATLLFELAQQNGRCRQGLRCYVCDASELNVLVCA